MFRVLIKTIKITEAFKHNRNDSHGSIKNPSLQQAFKVSNILLCTNVFVEEEAQTMNLILLNLLISFSYLVLKKKELKKD